MDLKFNSKQYSLYELSRNNLKVIPKRNLNQLYPAAVSMIGAGLCLRGR